MLSIMSKSPSARPTPHIVLNTIWKVEADESYHGRYGPTHQSCYIAIRTVDGVGEVKVDKTVHILRKNSLLVFRYDDMSYYEPAQDKWDFYWFEFEGSIPAVPLSVTVETEPYADDNEIMEQCFLSLSFPSEAAYVSTLFSSLLLRWLRGYEGEDTVEEGIIGASVEHLINNPEKCPTVSELRRMQVWGKEASESFLNGSLEFPQRNIFLKCGSKMPRSCF